MSGHWTEAEVIALRNLYASAPPLRLAKFAEEVGRHVSNVCRKARLLGLTDQCRKKVVERKVRSPKFATPEDLRRAQSVARKEWHATHPHPRGAKGMVHTAEARARISAKSKATWADPSSKHNSTSAAQRRSDLMLERIASGTMRSGYTRSAGGRRADLENRYFRSAWEANYARYLNFRLARGELAAWEYETKTFVFEKISRGTRAYTPDFKVIFKDGRHEWHEVKGWMDAKSVTRLKRMAKYFPGEIVRVIDEKWFRTMYRSGLTAIIPNWEKGKNKGSRGA